MKQKTTAHTQKSDEKKCGYVLKEFLFALSLEIYVCMIKSASEDSVRNRRRQRNVYNAILLLIPGAPEKHSDTTRTVAH